MSNGVDPRRQPVQPKSPQVDADDQTLVDANSSASPVDKAQGDQTMVDGTMMDSQPGQTAKPNSAPAHHARHDDESDEATFVASVSMPSSKLVDQTLPLTTPPDSKDADQTQLNDQPDASLDDRTQVGDAANAHGDDDALDDVTLAGPHAVPRDHDFDPTIVQSQYAADPDATHVQSQYSSTEDRNRTVIEGTGGIVESFDPDATQVSQEGKGGPTHHSQQRPAPAPRRPGAHETADRWETTQRYTLVSNFARGGLGQIWLANDNRLRREVAYKEMLPTALKNRPALERFLEEAQITGQLEHPGIVPIYDIGYQPNGAPFYSMKLVRGETFEKHIIAFHDLPKDSPERAVRFRKLLRHFIDICNAIGFAHDRGVLHRDLKPLNVMIGAFGETLVLDWGLAKVIDEVPTGDADQGPVTTSTTSLGTDEATMVQSAVPSVQPSVGQSQAGASVGGATRGGSMTGTRKMVFTDVRSVGSQTMMGSVMGTPAYMPPEQAKGKLDEIDARSDIYSLGGILYRLLTNKQPIEKGNFREVLDRVINNTIIPPQTHEPTTPGALAAIAMKALSRLREDRYQTALALAADVEAWVADEPVTCFEDPWTVKARRWAKKHRTAVISTSAAVGVALSGLIIYSGLHAFEMKRLRATAELALSDSNAAADQRDFKTARQTLTEAIGRISDQPELGDLKQTLESQMALFEERRVDQLRRDIEAKLETAETEIEAGRYDEARALLLSLQTQLADEKTLADQQAAAKRRLDFVSAAINERQQIAQTQQTFEQFQRDVDNVRARGSLLELEDIDDDAKQAMASGAAALKAFDLDQPQPLAKAPQHFEAEQPWVKQYQARTRQTPLEALREDAFEALLIMAEMEVTLARNAVEAERIAAAERALTRLTQAEFLGVKSQSLHARRADYLVIAGKQPEADRTLTAAQQMQPQSAIDNFLLGEALRKQSRYEDALSFYLKAQQQDPEHYWVQHCIGLCYLQLNQPVAATSCFSTCLALRPTYAWPHMLRGFCYAELKEFDSAYRDFDQALALDGKLYNVFINRGASYLKQQRFEEALKDFQKAAELKPDVAKPLINIAVVHREYARRLIDEPEPFDPTATAQQIAQRRQAREAEIGKRLDLALKSLADAAEAERAPSHPGIHQLRASIFEMQTNDALAIESYQRHLRFEREPQRLAQSHNALGKLHSRQGQYAKALEAFTAANKLQPTRADVVYQLGETHLQLQNFEAAIKSFQQFQKMVNLTIEDQIANPELLYSGIATAYDALGKKNEAIEYYTLSLIFDRSQAVPLTKRGWSYVTQANRLAQKDFEEATKLNPDNADSWTGLAYVQSGTGDIKAAMSNAQRAAELAVKQANDPAIGSKAWPLFFNTAEVYGRCHSRLVTAGPAAAADLKTAEQTAIRLLQLAAQAISKEADPSLRDKFTRGLIQTIQRSDDLRSIRESAAFSEAFKTSK